MSASRTSTSSTLDHSAHLHARHDQVWCSISPPDAFSNKGLVGRCQRAAVTDSGWPASGQATVACHHGVPPATQDDSNVPARRSASTVTADRNGTAGRPPRPSPGTPPRCATTGLADLADHQATTPNTAIRQERAGKRVWLPGPRQRTLRPMWCRYTMFHRHKHLGLCYGDSGWTKTPPRWIPGPAAAPLPRRRVPCVPGRRRDRPKRSATWAGGGTVVKCNPVVGAQSPATITYSNSQTATITRTERTAVSR